MNKFKLVGSADEENCLAVAVRLGWELLRLELATLGGGGKMLLGDEKRLDGVGKTMDDVVRLDGEGGTSVVDGFGASCFCMKAFSCNLRISAWAAAKLACCCGALQGLLKKVNIYRK